MTEHFFSA